MKSFRSSRRPLAVRSTLTAVGVALGASALGSALFTMALNDTVSSGLVTFAIFGGLAALSAGVVAWELASICRGFVGSSDRSRFELGKVRGPGLGPPNGQPGHPSNTLGN